jgi:hypothetical protein
LLKKCPDIDGFSFRVHYEGGIPDEGHERFWSAVFDALSATDKPLQVDMHAKGVDDSLLDAVDKPGLKPVLGAKYWAEHQGLPYHQASIRRLEESKPVPPGHELTAGDRLLAPLHAVRQRRSSKPWPLLIRILPLVTVAHGVGGSNNGNWPEMHITLPVTHGVDPGHYSRDTEQPPMWGTVSPFDPATFYVINEWAADALIGRYTPLEVAHWLSGFVADADEHVRAVRSATDPDQQTAPDRDRCRVLVLPRRVLRRPVPVGRRLRDLPAIR